MSSSTPPPSKRLCLLSLDGGGVRGLASIKILQSLMKQVNQLRETALHPWQLFDMIGGTSTGGLIAIMLGRLKMSLDDCEKAYCDLSRMAFTPKRSSLNLLRKSGDFIHANGCFDTGALENAIKQVIRDAGYAEEERLFPSEENCRVFVTTLLSSNSCTAVLRSYQNPEADEVLPDSCKIWEAGRATSAAKTFFDSISLGRHGQVFLDCGVKKNNPINVIYREAKDIWPSRVDEALFVSIGTGSGPGPNLDVNLRGVVDALKEIVTDTEETHAFFRSDHHGVVSQGHYFRFNVVHGLEAIGLEEHEEKAKIANAAFHYLAMGETREQLQLCGNQLSNAHLLPKTLRSAVEIFEGLAPGTGSIKPMTKKRQHALDRRLMQAILNDDFHGAEFLLKKGASPNANELVDLNGSLEGQKNLSVLQCAILLHQEQSEKIIIHLVDRGANIHFRDERGQTALHLATISDRVEVADHLLQFGAEIDAQNEDGSTALHLAVLANNISMVRFFKIEGADDDITDNRGFTPLDIASDKPYLEIEELLET